MATKIPKVAGYCVMAGIYIRITALYNWTCKSYIVKKVILILVTIGENKMHYMCLVYVFGNLFFQFCDFDSILHSLCVGILIRNLTFFLRKL